MGRRPFDTAYYEKFSIRRLPAWRYDKAQRLVADRKPPHPRRDDTAVKQLRKYLLAKEKLRTRFEYEDDLQYELAGRFTNLWAAEEIFIGGQDDRVRYKLEAGILAGLTDSEIQERLPVEAKTVKIYESLFYNVRERLDRRDYIAGTVLADTFMAGLQSRTPELTAKYFAYWGGPLALDLVTDCFTQAIAKPQEPSDLGKWLDEQFRLRIKTSAMIGISSMEPNNFNINTLLEGYTGLLSLAHREAATTGDDNVINRAIEIFVSNNPVPVGDEADKLAIRPGPEYGRGAVEPRVNELVVLDEAGNTPNQLTPYQEGDWVNPLKRRIESTDEKTNQR